MPLHVIALVSGGKDSFFSLLHCLANGHEVVALANLHPPSGAQEDLDSHMYQTVGHNLIPLYEHALSIPIYRQAISGKALNGDKSYQHDDTTAPKGVHDIDHDETESLVPLLEHIIKRHPEANALSSGAVLSSYQRTRIENVALRLRLTPLAYLWQYPTLFPGSSSALLWHLSSLGIDARIIKVASGGLDDTYLWQNVADSKVIPRLEKAVNRYGDAGPGAVLGEGGEYETIVVDGPSNLFRGRLVLNEREAKVVQSGGGSAFFSIDSDYASTVIKGSETADANYRQTPQIPPKFDPILSAMIESQYPTSILQTLHKDRHFSFPARKRLQDYGLKKTAEAQTLAVPPLFLMANVSGNPGDSLDLQMVATLTQMRFDLNAKNMGPENIAFTTLLLRDMSSFSKINDLYGGLFGKPNPPARVTIACGNRMPEGIDLLLTIIADSRPVTTRDGLHVQSRSYWAPANIGPYSQAMCIPLDSVEHNDRAKSPYLIYISGQIPLDPASMDILEDPAIGPLQNYWQQTVLALQHVERIASRMKNRAYLSMVAIISGTSHVEERAVFCRQAWVARACALELTAEEADIDPWDRLNLRSYSETSNNDQNDKSEVIFTGLEYQNFEGLPLIVLVDQLPRNASVEWVALGLSYTHEQSECHTFRLGKTSFTSTISTDRQEVAVVTSWIPQETVTERLEDGLPLHRLEDALREGEKEVHRPSTPYTIWSHATIYVDMTLVGSADIFQLKDCQVIPCTAVWSSCGTPLIVGIVQRVEVKQIISP